ncbi:MAG TPA: Xaa-Pro peptidase family protein [Vicinamibacterales bacterium]|nr:Xaa-Pro peptidase family protein [Vicinamibacterales bacterium]
MSLIQEKVAQAAGLLRELDLPCWLTFVRETGILPDPVMPFLAPGHVTWHSAFLVPANGEAIAIVGQYDRKAIEETGAYRRVEGYVESFKAPLLEALRALDPAAIAVNYSEDSEVCDGLTHGMFLTLRRVLAEDGYAGRLVSAERLVAALRARKTPGELARIAAAVRETERIFDEVGRFLAPGRTERDVAGFVTRLRTERGFDVAWEASTCPAVFTGPDTAGAHYGPTERAIARGHVVNMDFGVKHEDYCADLQRTFYVLRESEPDAPGPVVRGFETIVRAIEASRRALRPGVVGRDVDRVAREVLTAAGYNEFPHALGHQVGRFAHDGAALLGPMWEKYGGRPLVPIEEGMVFTLEPRLTVEGYGVATVEEMVVVTATGAEFLSNAQTELRLVG